jgi:hypothetical protein
LQLGPMQSVLPVQILLQHSPVHQFDHATSTVSPS